MKTNTDSLPAVSSDNTEDVEIYEYSKAVNPIASGATPAIPLAVFDADLYGTGPSRMVPLDLSEQLRCPSPATTPSLLASFLRVNAGESVATSPNASSEFFYVIRGNGHTETASGTMNWEAGDFFAQPGLDATHFASEDAALYAVNDAPLFTYLGAKRGEARFQPTIYKRKAVVEELDRARRDPQAANRSRISVLLANRKFEQTMTITHVLWTMFGVVPVGARQLPHRHQSVAVDFVVDAHPGAYTLVGAELNKDGTISKPTRVDWKSGCAFVTPPGYWHEHRNESKAEAYVMPIQDAGLHTYLRTLDIQFYKDDD